MRLIILTVNLRLLECSDVLGTREQNRSDTRAQGQITESHLKLFRGTIANRPTQYSTQSGLCQLSG